jgi:hypothetical protein
VALLAGGFLPLGAVGHDGGECGLALLVGLVHGLVAGGETLLASGLVAGLPGGCGGLGGGADGGEAGFPGAGARVAELVACPLGCPG